MSQEKPWGCYNLLCGDNKLWTKMIVVSPFSELSLQIHYERDEHWIVWKGMGVVTIEGKEIVCSPHDYFYIPATTVHRMSNPYDSELVFIEVAHGRVDEDDIIRLDDKYGR